MRIGIVALGFCLASACQPAPVVLGGVDLAGPVRALGTEPFWGIEIGASEIAFTGVDRPEIRVTNPGARMEGADAVYAARDAAGQELVIRLRDAKCSDGMSDFEYPLEAEVRLGGETLKGCAANQTTLDERPRE